MKSQTPQPRMFPAGSFTAADVVKFAAAMALTAVAASAQTTYDLALPSATAGAWSNTATWNSGSSVPGGNAADAIEVAGSPGYNRTVSLDFATSTTLDHISIGSDNNVTFQNVSGTGTRTINLTSGLTKTGAGAFTITPTGNGAVTNLSIGGALNVSAGTLTLGSDANGFGTFAATGGTTIASGAKLGLKQPTSANLGVATINGELALGSTGTGSGRTFAFTRLSGSGQIGAPVDFSSARTTILDFLPGAGTSATYSGSITQGAVNNTFALRLNGEGVQILRGNTSYSGTTTVYGGGVLVFAGTSTIGSGNITLSFSSSAQKSGVLGISSDFARNTGTGAGQIQLLGNTADSSGSGFAAYDRDCSVTLNGGAALTWNSAYFLGTGAGTTNARFILSDATATHKLKFTNDIAIGGGARTVSVGDGAAAVDAELSGVLSSASTLGTLTKLGTGTLALTGANTYVGATTVGAGTLLANNAGGSATGTGALTVAAGATLGGNGSIGGATTVNGTVAAGALAGSVGKLTFANSLALSGATASFDLNGVSLAGSDYDQIAVDSLTFSGSTTLTLNIGAGFLNALSAAGGSATLNLFTGSSLTGNFTSIVLAGYDTNSVLGNSLTGANSGISYLYNGDGTLTVTAAAIPEPASCAALVGALAAAAAFGARRRQRRA